MHPPLVTGNGARKWRGVEPSKESAAPPFSEEGFVRKQIEKGDMIRKLGMPYAMFYLPVRIWFNG